MSTAAPGLLLPTRTPTVSEQLAVLLDAGLAELAGVSPEELRSWAAPLRGDASSILVVHPCLVPPSRLATLLRRGSKRGFVVSDFADLDEFEAIDSLGDPGHPADPAQAAGPAQQTGPAHPAGPAHPLYLVHELERGDDLANWSPAEALPEIEARGRRPLTVSEGISWLLQQPEQLQPGRCFMTIGSRKRRGDGLDTRTPALWISGGTGRDGRARRGAPKVGWCWQGNRHTWLGIASAARR